MDGDKYNASFAVTPGASNMSLMEGDKCNASFAITPGASNAESSAKLDAMP